MRCIFAVARTVPLICLCLLFLGGAKPLAAGTDARPAERDVTTLTCCDLDAEGRPPLPLFWLDGYVSGQTDVDDIYLTWNAGRWRMDALPELNAQCRRTPDMALTEAWKTVMLNFRSPDMRGKNQYALRLGSDGWKEARSLIRRKAARPEDIATVQESLFAALLLWDDGRRTFEHGGGRPSGVAECRPAARRLATLSARLPVLSLGEALYLVREWPVDLAALTCRDTGGVAGRGRFFFMTGRWLSGWAAAWREHEPAPAAESGKADADATEPEVGSAFIDKYCARHPAVPVTKAWRDADDEVWRAAMVSKRSCADILRYGHDAVGWLLWWDGYSSYPSTRLPTPETFVARSAAIRSLCAANPRMPFRDAARKVAASLPENTLTPVSPAAGSLENARAGSALPNAPRRNTDVAVLTCRELAEAEHSAESALPPEIWLDGYVSAQMNLDYVPVGLWRTKYFVAELPLVLASQCRRTPDMTVSEAWKTVKMYESRHARVYLDAPCSDLLGFIPKDRMNVRNLALWWSGWRSWQKSGTYQDEPQEAAIAWGSALEEACKGNPQRPLREVLATAGDSGMGKTNGE